MKTLAVSLQFPYTVRSSRFNLARHVGGKIGDNYIKPNMSRWIAWCRSILSITHYMNLFKADIIGTIK